MQATVQNPAEADRIVRARIQLLISQPWFGTLALNLKVVESTAVATMATDGTRLFYNPTWTATQDDDVLVGTIAHEAMHCGLRHSYRCRGRDLPLWNRAVDYAINPLLGASNLRLPAGALRDPAYDGLPAETIYAQLVHDQQEQQDAPEGTDPDADPDAPAAPENADDGPDDLLPAPSAGTAALSDEGTPTPAPGASPVPGDPADDAEMTEVDWEIVTNQATMVANKRGLTPADADRAFRETLAPRVNWREVLRQFIERTMPQDYSWAQPNRRYIAQGLYLPAVVKENCPRLAVALDTSGSISQTLLDTFAAELTAIMLEVRPAAIDVLSCDARIQSVETFTADDGAIVPHPKGGGGTAFQPVMDWIAEQDEAPAALIYLTDLAGDSPTAPQVPVLWITPEWVTRDGLFGETIRIPH